MALWIRNPLAVLAKVGIPFADLGLQDWRDCWFSDDGPIGHRLDSYGLLGEPVEKKSSCIGSPAVEPECKFVEVIVEMLVLDAALVRTKEPAFEQRGDFVHAWHGLMRGD